MAIDRFKRDEELSRQVYILYITTKSKKEYTQAIKELSKKTNISESYLLRLLEEFYRETSTKEEKEEIQKIRKRNGLKYKEFVETLLSMSEEELIQRILEQKIQKCEINQFFKKYLEKITDEEELARLQEKYEYIIRVYNQILEDKKQNQENQNYENAIELFDKVISEGYFCLSEFRKENYEKYGLTESQFHHIIQKYTQLLKNKCPEKYQYYSEKLEENRMITFMNLKSKINKMLDSIPNSYDIIDYILNIDMSQTKFKKLCKGIVSPQDEVKINQFFSKYSEINYPHLQIVGCKMTINGEIISEETKTILLDFMKKNKIATNYFFICYKKYKNGELDEYLYVKQKRF